MVAVAVPVFVAGTHHIQLQLTLGVGELGGVTAAGEGDLFAVGRDRGRGVGGRVVSEPDRGGAVLVGQVDLIVERGGAVAVADKAIGPLFPGNAARVGAAATTTRRLAASIPATTTRAGLGSCFLIRLTVRMVLLPVSNLI